MLFKTLIPPNNKWADCGPEGMVKKGNEGLGKERLILFRIKQHSTNTLGLQLANIYSHCRLTYQRTKRSFQSLCGSEDKDIARAKIKQRRGGKNGSGECQHSTILMFDILKE